MLEIRAGNAYLSGMRVALALCLILAAAPVLAQDAPVPETQPEPQPETPPALMDQVEGLMQKFLDRIAPQMEQGLNALEPEIQGFLDQMRDMVQFYPPEVLPNGDILIRRRPPSDQTAPPSEVPDGDAPVVTPFEL